MLACAGPSGAGLVGDLEHIGRGLLMIKRVMLVAFVSAAARFLVAKIRAGQAEQSLWSEATDSVPPSR